MPVEADSWEQAASDALAPMKTAAAPAPTKTGAAPAMTRQEWFQEMTCTAWRRGQAALENADPAEAVRWLERAHRLAPEDASVSLSLAAVWLERGDGAEAAALLDEVVRRGDAREAWLILAACRHRLGEAAAAAAALAQAFSRHALPAEALLAPLADAIVAAAGLPGWCGLADTGRLVLRGVAGGVSPRVAFDGRAIRPQGLAASRRGVVPARVGEISVTLAGVAFLGSPVAVRRIRRVEGVVAARDSGLEGWAWHPGDPDTDAVLTIRRTSGGRAIHVRADDATMPAQTPLARPRRFCLSAERLAGMSGPLRVFGRDGRDLLGSPLDPGAERQAAAAAAHVVAGLFPLGGRRGRVDPPTQPAAPAQTRGPAAIARPAPRRRLAVVIAVHGGLRMTQACLESVFTTLPGGSSVVVVDDATAEPELARALDEWRRQGRIILLRHAVNRGFPASANAGMRQAAGMAGRPDIVLLNNDTLTPAGWLERLREAVHAAGDIGTATPLSNDATILSYPSPQGGNPAPDTAALALLARQAAVANPGVVVDIPTAVGFCMYIRRECLQAVGLFREDVFAQGYGEENDFCIRGRHLGWRHVAVPGVYVAHVGSQSFAPGNLPGNGGAGRDGLIARNLAVLERLHPGYHDLIAAFAAADPLGEARRRLDGARWRAGRSRAGSAILLTHDSGGGVERVVQARCAAVRARGLRPIVLRPILAEDGAGRYRPRLCRVGEAEGGFPNLIFSVPDELPALARLLRADRPEVLEVHHLLGHDHAILGLAEKLAISTEIHVHDYALICPRISLVGREGRYCGEPSEAEVCEACVADAGRNVEEVIGVAALRARSAADLATARRVVVPSADVALRLRRHFPAVAPEQEPLEDDRDLPRLAPIAGDLPRRVCVIGAIGPEKGYDTLLACARDAVARNLPIAFTVVGHTVDDERLFETGRVFVTGPYREADAEALIRAQQAQLAWLPSIWPETWCFTLGLAWRAGLGVAAFDIGAPAERIRRTGRGWLLPLGLPPPAVNNALLAVRTTAGDECVRLPNVP
jgi:GT2 family glycosyltransferase/glycosyltransferase involved in cell wall biosynthesis